MDDWDEINDARDRALEKKELEAIRNRALDKDTLAAKEALKGKAFPTNLPKVGSQQVKMAVGTTRWPRTPSGYPQGNWSTTGENGKDSEGTLP